MGACEITPSASTGNTHATPDKPTVTGPSSPSMIFRPLPASSSFVLAAARLRALQLDPPAARREDPGSREEGSRGKVSPSTENTTSPRTWPPGRNGSTPPNDPGAWPSPPTPNCAAATLGGSSSPCVLPNQPPPARPDATPCNQPQTASSPRQQPRSATQQCSVNSSARDGRTPAADRAWRPWQGLPRYEDAWPGCDPAAAQTGDHPLGQDPPPRRRARHRTRGWRLTTADRATADAELTGSALSAWETLPSKLPHGLTCEADYPPVTVRDPSSPGLMAR